MRSKKLLKSVLVVALSMTMVVGQGSVARAATKETISMNVSGDLGEKYISMADCKVLAKEFGYDNVSQLSALICDENTKVSINWKNSKVKYKDVYGTQILFPKFSRDKNGKLVVEKYKKDGNGKYGRYEKGDIKYTYEGSVGWYGSKVYTYAGGELEIFDIRDEKYYNSNSINNRMGTKKLIDYKLDKKGDYIGFTTYKPKDVYILRIQYTTDKKGNLYYADMTHKIDSSKRKTAFLDFYVFPKGVKSKLKFTKTTKSASIVAKKEDFI